MTGMGMILLLAQKRRVGANLCVTVYQLQTSAQLSFQQNMAVLGFELPTFSSTMLLKNIRFSFRYWATAKMTAGSGQRLLDRNPNMQPCLRTAVRARQRKRRVIRASSLPSGLLNSQDRAKLSCDGDLLQVTLQSDSKYLLKDLSSTPLSRYLCMSVISVDQVTNTKSSSCTFLNSCSFCCQQSAQSCLFSRFSTKQQPIARKTEQLSFRTLRQKGYCQIIRLKSTCSRGEGSSSSGSNFAKGCRLNSESVHGGRKLRKSDIILFNKLVRRQGRGGVINSLPCIYSRGCPPRSASPPKAPPAEPTTSTSASAPKNSADPPRPTRSPAGRSSSPLPKSASEPLWKARRSSCGESERRRRGVCERPRGCFRGRRDPFPSESRWRFIDQAITYIGQGPQFSALGQPSGALISLSTLCPIFGCRCSHLMSSPTAPRRISSSP